MELECLIGMNWNSSLVLSLALLSTLPNREPTDVPPAQLLLLIFCLSFLVCTTFPSRSPFPLRRWPGWLAGWLTGNTVVVSAPAGGLPFGRNVLVVPRAHGLPSPTTISRHCRTTPLPYILRGQNQLTTHTNALFCMGQVLINPLDGHARTPSCARTVNALCIEATEKMKRSITRGTPTLRQLFPQRKDVD